MTRLPYLFLICLLSPLLQAAASAPAERHGLMNPGYEEKPAWFKDSFLDIREDVAEAAEAGRLLLLYFYQDGCPYCSKLLHDNFGDQAIAEKTRRHFEVIALNMWGDREVTGLRGESVTEKQFAAGLKVQFTPTLLFLDDRGEPVVRLNGYYQPHHFSAILDYVAGRRHSGQSLREYIAAVDPQPASGKLHLEAGFFSAPVDLSAVDDEKPLLVLFEQQQCRACDELHQEILQREAVRTSLDGFSVALLDMWSREALTTPAGEQTTAREWAQSLGIQYAPSLLFFDRHGKEVFRSEGYLRAFHVHGVLDYVRSGAYRQQPEFQRYLQERRADFERRGLSTDLWE